MKDKNLHLNETGNRSVFKVPENYFDDFQAALNKRIDSLEAENEKVRDVEVESKPKRLFLKMDSIRPVLYMAAMFVLLLFSVGLVLNLTSDKTSSSLHLSAESTTQTKTPATNIPTAEDYLINSVGTYGITEYYIESGTEE